MRLFSSHTKNTPPLPAFTWSVTQTEIETFVRILGIFLPQFADISAMKIKQNNDGDHDGDTGIRCISQGSGRERQNFEACVTYMTPRIIARFVTLVLMPFSQVL